MPATVTEAQAHFIRLVEMPREARLDTWGEKFMAPLDHPGITAAGPDFARTVHELLDVKVAPNLSRNHKAMEGLDQLYRSALYMRKWKLQVGLKGQLKTVDFLPGGLWTLPPAFDHRNSTRDIYDYEWSDYLPVNGPRARAKVMLVGKHPGAEELEHGQNFIGLSSEPLHRALRDIKVKPEVRRAWYVTNTVKHNRLDPTSGNMQQSWLKNCTPLLYEEILLVRPKFIACLGTEAIKAVLGKGYTVSNMKGRVVELTFRVPPDYAKTHADFDDLDLYVDHKVMVMGIPHPSYISHVPEAYPDIRDGLETFVKMVGGDKPPDVEKDKGHTPVYTKEKLGDIVDRIIKNAHENWDFEVDGDLPIAWDAEWHGRQPGDEGSYLRTIQFAAGYDYKEAPKRATCVIITEKGGTVNGWFHSREEITDQLNRLIEGRHSDEEAYPEPIRTRHGGHFFKADIPWIRHFLGIDFGPLWETPPPLPPLEYKDDDGKYQKLERLVPWFDGIAYRKEVAKLQTAENDRAQKAGEKPKEIGRDVVDRAKYRNVPHHQYQLTRYSGGFDTGYMTHAVFEAVESFELEQLAMRWTTCPRWGVGLENAKKRIAKEMGIKVRDLIGFGDIPDDDILGYAMYDADGTLRLFWKLNFARSVGDGDGFLDQDVYHNPSREAYWRTMLAGPTFLEMEETGVTVDVARGKDLIKVFELVKERLTGSLRDDLKWPKFNPNSTPQVRALLFGEKYSGSIDKKTGENKKLLPEHFDEEGLGKDPIKTTGKPAKAWANIHPNDKTPYTPAVDKEVLGMYSWQDPRIKKLRDIKYVRQVLQSVLRPPKVGEAIGADGDGGMVYDELDEFDGGFLSYVNARDSRVRSRFYPVETGRCSSAGPNQQNLAKRREDDYARILGHFEDDGTPKGDYLDILNEPLYRDPIRSIVTAGYWDDEPTVLMEFDIVSAEIAALAWESGDQQMIADVNRAMLDEDDPDFLDIHSSTAVEAFKLNCAPTKKALKALGKPGLRVAAKNVRFGVPYGRSAEALARQCREEGADVSVADCKRLIDNYNTRYSDAADFLADCENRPYSEDKRFIIGAFGRLRRFLPSDDKSVMADQGRSAKNYPIQNLVADYILMGMYNLRQIREKMGLQGAFRVALQIHDALMLEVKIPYIGIVRDEVIPAALTDGIDIMPRTLDGTPFSKLTDDNDKLTVDDKKLLGLYLEKPYKFKVDSSVFLNWGQPIDPERGRSLGIPEEYLGGK